jgi:carbonic anhydrase
VPNKEIFRLLTGFRQFREKFYSGSDTTYTRLSSGGQGPKILVIGCSDSRVDPAILSGAGPGELFVVRNVANLVPPYDPDGGRHGVSAAMEFAIVNLKVENVIVLGHRQCGGIRALLFPEEIQAGGFVQRWVKIAEPAKARALALVPGEDSNGLWRQCELESIRTSLENLRSFPFVQEAIASRGLNLLGVYFDLEKGELLELNEKDGSYSAISI